MKESISAYIHIPFCEHICYYCNFNKVFLEGQPVDEYIDALLQEVDMTIAKYPTKRVPTLYIGGGTPTSLSAKQLDRLLDGLFVRLPLGDLEEFTVEANPGDLDVNKIEVLRNYNVDRVSMGVQTFDDELLKKIGRKHTAQDVYQTIKLLRSKSLDNLTIDLMYALPNQTIEMFMDSVKKAVDLEFNHLSMYALILENRTLFANLERQGKLHRPSEEVEITMFEQAKQYLEQFGIYQYEICNYSKKGYESKHNLMYWDNEHYYGFGAGASGYLGNIRYKNHGPVKHYLQEITKGLPVVDRESLSIENRMEEHMFLGLRKLEGVSFDSFEHKFGRSMFEIYGEVLKSLKNKDYIEMNNSRVRLTDKGLLFGNDVFAEFLLGE